MKIIPLFWVSNIKEAVAFYTQVLDFELKYPEAPLEEWGVELVHGDAELVLSSTDGSQGVIVNVYVDDVDQLFARYVARGLNPPGGTGVHHSPIDQTWERREFYVEDADGNTLRFTAPLRRGS